MKTGDVIRAKFTYSDGTVAYSYRYVVPHDSAMNELCDSGAALGWDIMDELARQDPLEIVKVEIEHVE